MKSTSHRQVTGFRLTWRRQPRCKASGGHIHRRVIFNKGPKKKQRYTRVLLDSIRALIILLTALMLAVPAPAREYPVSGPQGGLSMKVCLPKGFDPTTDSCHMEILMHIVEGENHLIIKKRRKVIGIIRDFLKRTL